MALADIQKKSAEERKREKRLVHTTNALGRDFLASKALKGKTKSYKDAAEYLAKSLLDYLFFEEEKELKELNEQHISHFMLFYAPNKLTLSAEVKEYSSEILTNFVDFLNTHGHIKNGELLSARIKEEKKTFLKSVPGTAGTRKPKSPATRKKTEPSRKTAKSKIEIKVGRNDPCPCGSGKKFKKCCGQK
jgi:preprotein translocase subunit SecA